MSYPLGTALAVGNVAILGAIVAIAVHGLQVSHEAHFAQARQATENLALTLSLGIASDIKQVDNALSSTRSELDQAHLFIPDPRQIVAAAERNRALVPQAEALHVTDAQGRIFAIDGAAVSVGDRPYFEAARQAPDRLQISEPVLDRLSRKWGLVLARARTDSDGQFRGIVHAVLSTDYLTRTFDDVSIGRSGAVSLRTASMRLVARYTLGQYGADAATGSSNVSPELRDAIAKDPSKGFYVSRTAIDGVERANAYRQVEGYPLKVIVGLGTEEFYGQWKRELATTAALSGLLAAMVVALSLLAYRAQSRILRMHASLRLLTHEQQAVLDNELVGMSRVRDRVALWHNRAMARLFGYGLDELRNSPARLLYADDESYERIGRAYALLRQGEQFRTQLQMRRKDGRLLWIDLSGVHLPTGDALWMMLDISALKETESRARHMALHDPLTGLANRSGLHDQLGSVLEHALRDGSQVALCFVDLDGFKGVNDVHGHEAGDEVLRICARRIASCIRSHDMVVRFGGDEFVVVLTRVGDDAEVPPALRRILEVLRTPFSVGNDAEVRIGASLGVALFPRDGAGPDDLLSKADAAMYVAKRGGKARFSFHGDA